MTNKAGVYRIKNDVTGKVYVGRAINIAKRWTSHRWHLAKGIHRNGPLQADWIAHGAGAFTFEVLQIIEGLEGDKLNEALANAEVDHVLKYVDIYNLMEAGQLALTPSDQTRALWSEQRKALWTNPNYREQLSATHKAKHADPSYSVPRAASIRAAKNTDENRAAVSAHSHSLWADPEHRKEQGAKRKANWKDPEYRARQKASREAAWADPEVRARRSAAIAAGHARRRAAKDAAKSE